MKYTRKQHMAGECDHRTYYAQLVTGRMVDHIGHTFGPRILASTDEHLNDIPLKEWDRLPHPRSLFDRFEQAGDFATWAGLVCAWKEAARQWAEGQEAQTAA